MNTERPEYTVSISFEGVKNYRSIYGEWTADRSCAKHYSKAAAEQQVRNFLSIAKHDEEHRYYNTAVVEPVEQEVVIY